MYFSLPKSINPAKAVVILMIFLSSFSHSLAQKKDKSDDYPLKSSYFSALKFRSVGPALTSGRIADLAVNPNNPSEYFVATASGGVWKTTNAGTTYIPVFDQQGSYSIGCVSYDPSNPSTIWVGTGENNNQRSVAYGDGVYKSEDGGKSWKNMGLKTSEHIGAIVVHPNNSQVIYVSSMGPLWNAGGERGVYKSEDGGATWTRVLEIDEHTGVADLIMDPRDPNVLYAASQQRRRHVFTYIGGGPGSAVHKTEDGGKTWKKVVKGMPTVDLGRIGLSISPANPDVVYAIVEASQDKGGFYRSDNRGASWDKMSSYSTSGNYYQEIVCDPVNVDKVFIMDTWLHHTIDGGKKIIATGEDTKHVDNHTMWIDPKNTDHWLVGCDGGLYETYDHAKTWDYKSNLPITQFYKVSVDNDLPFYNIYGGTQDNNTQGGPSRTINEQGISNADWYITRGGDGFETVIDPIDANIVYSQSQYGWLVRYDRKSGETVGIKPQHRLGEPALRWNWDAPLIISPHNHTRLYFAANKLFRSDDRGNSWSAISGDLTRQLDRNKMEVMGRVWEMEAVEKNKSTTIYGNIVALDESPIQQGLIYLGTDDGLIQITEDNGNTWRKVESIPGIPDLTYVNAVVASSYQKDRVYAIFNNHKRGDFKPYIARSNDKGKSWTLIQGNLPDRGSVYDIAEDHKNPNLLFAGTEFGAFFTLDAGEHWIQLKSGLPTIAVRDLEIQRRENDLVLGTFGRGFYVLDDYSALQNFKMEDTLSKGKIYPIKNSLMYFEARPLGGPGKASQGDGYFRTPNPEVGAVFTYILNDTMETLQSKRLNEQKKIKKEGGDVFYPSADRIRKEDAELDPYLIFEIKDSVGNVIRRLKQKSGKGMQRVVWDFHLPSTSPVRIKVPEPGRYGSPDKGPMAMPGKYTVTIYSVKSDGTQQLTEPTAFIIQPLNNITLPPSNRDSVIAFQNRAADLYRKILASNEVKSDLDNRIKHLRTALDRNPGLPLKTYDKIRSMELSIREIEMKMYGDQSLSKHEFETPNSLMTRIYLAQNGSLFNSTEVTETSQQMYQEAKIQYDLVKKSIRDLEQNVKTLESEFDAQNIPYTPGRAVPDEE